jgi:hypothetical protein
MDDYVFLWVRPPIGEYRKSAVDSESLGAVSNRGPLTGTARTVAPGKVSAN